MDFDQERPTGNRCLTLQPGVFARVLEDCEELVYTQGTYLGWPDTVPLPNP